jgi:subtilisin family serine protease
MAAPHVTGAVALLLSRRVRQGLPQLNAAQIRAAMSQCLGGYNGSWNRAGGHGWLDIPSLLQTLG